MVLKDKSLALVCWLLILQFPIEAIRLVGIKEVHVGFLESESFVLFFFL